MAWYRAGTVAVTNGNATVIGTNTDFVSNTQVGESFIGPNGLSYEIAAVVSATQLTLSDAYQGPSGGGQSYKIQPTQSFARDLALAFAGFKNTFGGILDTIGQGLFGDGNVAAPGIRFAADQDTGIRRSGANALALVAGGRDVLTVDPSRIGVSTSFVVDGAADSSTPVARFIGNNANGQVAPLPGLSVYWNRGNGSQETTLVYGAGGSSFLAMGHHDGSSYAERLRIDNVGNVGIGTATPDSRLEVATPSPTRGVIARFRSSGGSTGAQIALWQEGVATWAFGQPAGANAVAWYTGRSATTDGVELMRLTEAGNLLVGTPTFEHHHIRRNVGAGNNVLSLSSAASDLAAFVYFQAVTESGWANPSSAFYIGRSGTTGRSINAGGTINASGADYAEYVRKAAGCERIAKGDVCGIDRNGELVRTWAGMLRPVIKSTDPNLVGGDIWSAHLGPRPEEPVLVTPVFDGPAEPEEGADRRAYDAARADHAKAVAAAEAAHAAALEQHAAALAAWEADLEAARQTVDRIAFCGQVPVNVDADTLAACEAALADGVAVYLVAIAKGAGIGVTAVREPNMTLQAYMKRVGAVWAIRDGRPWVDVQHG